MKIQLNKNSIINLSLAAVLVVTYLLGLFIPLTSDAGKYAAISRIIYETGDWINLKIHFEPYLQKPPLIFWVTTPFFFLFGLKTFAFKLPILIYSGIAILSTYKFSRIYYSKETAKLAALMLATCEFYFLFHNDIHTDSLLTANVIFSIWQIAAYLKTKKTVNVILAGLGVGLAIISKGPIGIFVPVTATLSHLIYTKKIKIIFSYKILLAAIVMLFVLCFGLLGIYKQFGWEGIRFIFWDNNTGRISGAIKGNNTDYSFYFHTTLYIFLPWGFLFFISAFSEIRDFFRKQNQELFSIGGIILYWIVISYAKAKAPHYFMVLSPFMALLSAKWIIRYFQEAQLIKYKKTVIIVQYLTIILLWILLIALCIYFFPSKNILFWFIIAILLGLTVISKSKNQFTTVIKRSVISIIAINFAINAHLFPQIFTYQSVKAACEVFNKEADDDEMLNSYLSEHRELFFYAKNPGHFLYDKDDLQECLKNEGSWIYTSNEGLEDIKKMTSDIEIVKSFRHRSISKLTGGFINPKTRQQRLKQMYLIHIK